jgi:hypothetical protein
MWSDVPPRVFPPWSNMSVNTQTRTRTTVEIYTSNDVFSQKGKQKYRHVEFVFCLTERKNSEKKKEKNSILRSYLFSNKTILLPINHSLHVSINHVLHVFDGPV